MPGFHQIEVSINFTFDEDATFNKSRNNYTDEDHEEEKEALRIVETSRPPVRDVEE